jgi:hypothetical protein
MVSFRTLILNKILNGIKLFETLNGLKKFATLLPNN